MAIRIYVPVINFKGNFNDCLSEAKKCLNSAMRLLKLLNKIAINKLY